MMPTTLDRYLVRQFFPVFFAALALFTMMIVLIDLFLFLTRYLSNGAAFPAILKVSLFYIPKSISYALPISLLFASAFTLGDLSSKNELLMILGAGIPFLRFCLFFIIIGAAASIFAFFFEDRAVIPALRQKNRMNRELLMSAAENFSNIVIKLEEGRLVYAVDYYDPVSLSLIDVTIIEMDENKNLYSIVYAPRAEWTGSGWNFSDSLYYTWDNGFLRPIAGEPDTEKYREDPETFRRSSVSAEDLNVRDTALLIRDLRRAGLPVASALTNYYQRFSFSAVPFVVIFLSLTVSGRFKKNTLLLSLLASLGTAVIYYVIEMISMMSARAGILHPFLGAWIPVFVCTAAGFILLKNAEL